ncbi:MAG TPA: YggS family pyridoxal phosphate-dependent enzyme [Vicinamibacterales bacterium]|nr:YggS family pyridoxal phosphate-dependent enzyme [Vicinamibacterales bacterium]
MADVRDRIARAADRARRNPSSVRLIAVSKTFGADAVRAAAAEGQIDFGENKVQEAQTKRAETRDLTIVWHLIGHLQSNKAKKAVAEFDVIHSVDSVELLRKIDAAAADAGRSIALLVQADLAREATKHGAAEPEILPIFQAAAGCRAVKMSGLMLIPPAVERAEDARPWFRKLRELRDGLISAGVDRNQLTELSMGMSHDYEVAIEEGATMVRVGTAIFGRR